MRLVRFALALALDCGVSPLRRGVLRHPSGLALPGILPTAR
jgi:hypothetical protein